MRVVRTTTTAQHRLGRPGVAVDDLDKLRPDRDLERPIRDRSRSAPTAATRWRCPRANFTYWVVPNQLQAARWALAETMARPDLNELAPTSSNNAINGQPQLYYGGTAGLEARSRRKQADLSLEWYYGPHSALTVALFGKKISDDIYTGGRDQRQPGHDRSTSADRPGTGDNRRRPSCGPSRRRPTARKSTYSGVELTWQHIMDNGFGTHMQFTAHPHPQLRSVRQLRRRASMLHRPTTFTIGLLYDKGPISADVNWDHQSELHRRLLAVHRGSGLAGDLQSLRLGDREPALPLWPRVRGLLSRARISPTPSRAPT